MGKKFYMLGLWARIVPIVQKPINLFVAKIASHVIFQYNILVIDIDNTTLGLI